MHSRNTIYLNTGMETWIDNINIYIYTLGTYMGPRLACFALLTRKWSIRPQANPEQSQPLRGKVAKELIQPHKRLSNTKYKIQKICTHIWNITILFWACCIILTDLLRISCCSHTALSASCPGLPRSWVPAKYLSHGDLFLSKADDCFRSDAIQHHGRAWSMRCGL